jgi:DNA-binding NarL/FixJ family response regulator
VRSLSAIEAPSDRRRTPESLHTLMIVCLEELADLAQIHGQSRRAARLLDAAALLRDQHTGTAEPNPLTRREWEVAGLVSRGFSNRQIAEQLVLSERTVDTHVSHILRKLGLNSRAQIAAWAVENSRRLTLLA